MSDSRIHLLDSTVIDQIAAGEVVDRPASVVRELVDNAIDAQASSILVELKEGGQQWLRVVDNGAGMAPQDASLALRRHATSKLRSIEDLQTLRSLGFRGEALPSIAGVSKLTLKTRRAADNAGTELSVYGGTLQQEPRPVAMSPGTIVDVAELFYNVPARRKFLRATATEAAQTSEVIVRMALAYPQLAFRQTHNGRLVRSLEATDSASKRVASIWPNAHWTEARDSFDGVRITAFFSPEQPARRASIYLFVNGRALRDPRLQQIVGRAVREQRPDLQGHVPSVLFLEMDPTLIDINVHPQKAEVRFAQPRTVHQALFRIAAQAFAPRLPIERFLDAASHFPSEAGWAGKYSRLPLRDGDGSRAGGYASYRDSVRKAGPSADQPPKAPTIPSRGRSEELGVPTDASARSEATDHPGHAPSAAWHPRGQSVNRPTTAGELEPEQPEPLDLDSAAKAQDTSQGNVVAAIDGRYLLVLRHRRIELYDASALHRAVQTSRVHRDWLAGRLPRRSFRFPPRCNLDRTLVDALPSIESSLEQIGFVAHRFGEREVVIRAAPSIVAEAQVSKTFAHCAQVLLGGGDESIAELLAQNAATPELDGSEQPARLWHQACDALAQAKIGQLRLRHFDLPQAD